jgi:hypothetical protein
MQSSEQKSVVTQAPKRLAVARTTLRAMSETAAQRVMGGMDTLTSTCSTCVSDPTPGCTETCTCPGAGCIT